MVYNGKPNEQVDDLGSTIIFGNTHIKVYEPGVYLVANMVVIVTSQ